MPTTPPDAAPLSTLNVDQLQAGDRVVILRPDAVLPADRTATVPAENLQSPAHVPTAQEIFDQLAAAPNSGISVSLFGGKVVIGLSVTAPAAPAAPTNGQVDDTADTFSGVLVPGFPAGADYEVFGPPGFPGIVNAATAGGDVQNGRVYSRGLTGQIVVGGAGIRVAASGNRPAGAWLLNATAFTGAAAITPPPPQPAGAALTAALAISVASITAGQPVTFSVTPGGGTSPYAYSVVATNNATGQTTVLGASGGGSWTPQTAGSYNIDATVTDSSNPVKTARATTRVLQVTAGADQPPVANAGSDLTVQQPTSTVQLMGSGSDPDPSDTITELWSQVTGPVQVTFGTPTLFNTTASGLTAVGMYQFRITVTDNHGLSTPANVVVTVAAAAAPTLGAPSPGSGAVGSRVTLLGTNLSGATGYSFNGVAGSAANITGNTATSLTLVVPQGATSGSVTVTGPGGTATSSSAFTVQAAGTPTLAPLTGYSASPYQDGLAQQLSTAVANATAYTFEIATDAAFTVGHQSATQTSLTKNWLGLTANARYYTRLTATAPGYVSSVATADATTAPAVASVALSSIASIPNDADLSMESTNFGTDGTAAIQAFFDSYGNNFAEIYWDKKVSAGNLVLPSSVRITTAPGCGLILRPNVGGFGVRNRNFRGMNAAKDGLAARVDQLVSIDGLIYNGNGYLGTVAQQPHDTAPGNGQPGGWTIPIRLAGVETVVVKNCQSLNQTTFAGFISNAGTVTNLNNVVKSNPSRPRNSDGWKHMGITTLRIDALSGFTGDDITSVDGADGLYDVYPLPAHTGAGQLGYDPAAIWAPIGDVEIGTIDLQDSGFGVRFSTSTIETKISNIFLQRLQGTSRNQAAIFDNYAEDPSAFFAPAGPRPGYIGKVNCRELVAELTGSSSYKPATYYLNSIIEEFRVGYFQRRLFSANNYPTFLVDTGSRITNFVVEAGSVVPTTANNNTSILEVAGYIGTCTLAGISLDYRGLSAAGATMVAPLVRMRPGGRIDTLHLTNCTAYAMQNLVELSYGGSIGQIVLDGVVFQPGVATQYVGAIYVDAGFTVGSLAANGCSAGARLLAGTGTVTTQSGNSIPRADALQLTGTYEEDDSRLSRTSGWAVTSDAYHSAGHALTSTDHAQEHYTYLHLAVAVVPTLISGTYAGWGTLEILLDDQPYALIDQSTTNASFHVTPATGGALAPIPAGPHKLTRRPLTAGLLTVVDALQLA